MTIDLLVHVLRILHAVDVDVAVHVDRADAFPERRAGDASGGRIAEHERLLGDTWDLAPDVADLVGNFQEGPDEISDVPHRLRDTAQDGPHPQQCLLYCRPVLLEPRLQSYEVRSQPITNELAHVLNPSDR